MEIETKGLEHEVELSKAEELGCTCTDTDVNMPTIAGTARHTHILSRGLANGNWGWIVEHRISDGSVF
jgi:hypothetical protein